LKERRVIFVLFKFAYAVMRRVYSYVWRYFLSTKDLNVDFGFRAIGTNKISIGKGFRAGKDLWMASVSYTGVIQIGEFVSVSDYVHIASKNFVKIGNNVLIGSHVMITDHDHGSYSVGSQDFLLPPSERTIYVKGIVNIEDNVWIGDGVKILSGVRIGRNSVIAANSVVTKDVPSFSLVGGVPAKIMKNYSIQSSFLEFV